MSTASEREVSGSLKNSFLHMGWRLLRYSLLPFGLGLLAYTLYGQRGLIDEIRNHSWDWRLYALAVCCVLSCELIAAFRWYILVQTLVLLPWGAAWRLGLIGMVSNVIVPTPHGGDLVKAGIILSKRIPRMLILSSLFLDRLIGLFGMILLAAAAALKIWPDAPSLVRPLLAAIWIATISGVLGLLAFFHPITLPILFRVGVRFPVLHSYVEKFAALTRAYRASWPRIMLALVLAITSHFLNIAAFFLIGRMLFPSSHVDLMQYLVLVPLVLAVCILPLPAGALGVTEETSQQLFQFIGHPGGALLMLGYRAVQLGAVVIGAVVYLSQWQHFQNLGGYATSALPPALHHVCANQAHYQDPQ